MQLRADALPAHLARGRLARLYTLCGEEPLLVIEAQDAVRAAARRAGFTERTVLQADAKTDWSLLEQATQSLSLFAERRLVEVRLPNGKPGKAGAQALLGLAARVDDDLLVTVALPKLDKGARESAWASALAQAGVWVDAPAIDRAQLPGWLAARLARQEQQCEPAALAFLAERVEGNLLAGHQEVLKLGLLFPPGTLSLECVADSVLHVARYDVFALPLAMLGGDRARVARTVEGLQAEGAALPLVVWALAEELRGLLRIRAALAAGRPFQVAARESRYWGMRSTLAERALPGLSTTLLSALLARCADLDRLSKGLRVLSADSDPWLELADIAARFAAHCTVSDAVRATAAQ
jgi:DNA polymerase-3 subunit delta